MNPEQRKNYNKEYYEKNKLEILAKASTKVECEFCHRKVSSYNLSKHYTLPICLRKSELLKNKHNRLANQAQ